MYFAIELGVGRNYLQKYNTILNILSLDLRNFSGTRSYSLKVKKSYAKAKKIMRFLRLGFKRVRKLTYICITVAPILIEINDT